MADDIYHVVAALSADMKSLSQRLTDMTTQMQIMEFRVGTQHEAMSQSGGVPVRLAVIEANLAQTRKDLAETQEALDEAASKTVSATKTANVTFWSSLSAVLVALATAIVQWVGNH